MGLGWQMDLSGRERCLQGLLQDGKNPSLNQMEEALLHEKQEGAHSQGPRMNYTKKRAEAIALGQALPGWGRHSIELTCTCSLCPGIQCNSNARWQKAEPAPTVSKRNEKEIRRTLNTLTFSWADTSGASTRWKSV